MGLVCIQNSSLLAYSKSQKVSASYCLTFQHSRGKNQPVGGFCLPPACLGLTIPVMKSHKTNSLEPTTKGLTHAPAISQKNPKPKTITHNEEKIAFVLYMAGGFAIWNIFQKNLQ